VDALAFEHHLASPQGHGRLPRGGHDGAAGGAACGDLVRISVAVDGDRVADAGFDASGCGAAQAAGSAVVSLVRGRPLLEAARVGVHEVADELGGLSPGKLHAAELAADALHRALGAAAWTDGRVPRVAGRTLVAMSGGVDSTVVALLTAEAGADVVAVTVELWADAENDAERSCCSASAVRDARALAHGLGLPHFTLDLRDRFRAGVVDPFLAAYTAGETPNPCVRCNGSVRLDDMLALADRVGAATLATGHYARVADDGEGPLLRAAADPKHRPRFLEKFLFAETARPRLAAHGGKRNSHHPYNRAPCHRRSPRCRPSTAGTQKAQIRCAATSASRPSSATACASSWNGSRRWRLSAASRS